MFVTLTRRTNDPKLAYLEFLLDEAGIPSRRNGESAHAPILEVDQRFIDDAWALLDPIDNDNDDDPRYIGSEYLRDSMREAFDECAEIRKAALDHAGRP
jgi:hypothetical protein